MYYAGIYRDTGRMSHTALENIDFSSVRANFYKCGDECETPHYIAMFPVTTLPPGFNNPECFKEFKLIERV